MKISILLIIVFGMTANIFPQLQFNPHTITTSADGAYSVYAVDVDGDGDMDVLSASNADNKIAWYENDGNENFLTHIITTDASHATSVYAVDVDGDGDIDVLSASFFDDKIAWYENDGKENFTTRIITIEAVWASSVYAIDIDSDGDMDVLSAGDKIAWYENDGKENFTSHTISTSADGAYSVYAVDVDGDGDMDVLSASYDDKIAWYENDGNENFTPHTIKVISKHASTVYAVDVDGDGDIDVLAAFYNQSDIGGISEITWYENDGNENFTPHTIATGGEYGFDSVYAIDVDGDGHMDVLSASYSDDKIAWYENLTPPIPVELTSFTASTSQGKVTLNWATATETNNQVFEIERNIEDGQFVTIGYVEGNGTTTEPQEYSYIDNTVGTGIYYYRLKQIDFGGQYEYSDEIEVEVNGPLTFALEQNYPNPFNPSTLIKYSVPENGSVKLSVYNLVGEEVSVLVNQEVDAGFYEATFNAADFPSGIYFYKLQSDSFVETKKMVLMK